MFGATNTIVCDLQHFSEKIIHMSLTVTYEKYIYFSSEESFFFNIMHPPWGKAWSIELIFVWMFKKDIASLTGTHKKDVQYSIAVPKIPF